MSYPDAIDITPSDRRLDVGDTYTAAFSALDADGNPTAFAQADATVTVYPAGDVGTDRTADLVQDGDDLTLTLDLTAAGTWAIKAHSAAAKQTEWATLYVTPPPR